MAALLVKSHDIFTVQRRSCSSTCNITVKFNWHLAIIAEHLKIFLSCTDIRFHNYLPRDVAFLLLNQSFDRKLDYLFLFLGKMQPVNEYHQRAVPSVKPYKNNGDK